MTSLVDTFPERQRMPETGERMRTTRTMRNTMFRDMQRARTNGTRSEEERCQILYRRRGTDDEFPRHNRQRRVDHESCSPVSRENGGRSQIMLPGMGIGFISFPAMSHQASSSGNGDHGLVKERYSVA